MLFAVSRLVRLSAKRASVVGEKKSSFTVTLKKLATRGDPSSYNIEETLVGTHAA